MYDYQNNASETVIYRSIICM